jgi:hypothetical protein
MSENTKMELDNRKGREGNHIRVCYQVATSVFDWNSPLLEQCGSCTEFRPQNYSTREQESLLHNYWLRTISEVLTLKTWVSQWNVLIFKKTFK